MLELSGWVALLPAGGLGLGLELVWPVVLLLLKVLLLLLDLVGPELVGGGLGASGLVGGDGGELGVLGLLGAVGKGGALGGDGGEGGGLGPNTATSHKWSVSRSPLALGMI